MLHYIWQSFISKAEKLHLLCAKMIVVALGMQNMMQIEIWVSKVELETATTCTIRLSIYYWKTYFTFIASQNQAVTNWLGYLVSVNCGIIAVPVTKSHAIHCVDPARLYSSDRVIKTEITISVYVWKKTSQYIAACILMVDTLDLSYWTFSDTIDKVPCFMFPSYQPSLVFHIAILNLYWYLPPSSYCFPILSAPPTCMLYYFPSWWKNIKRAHVTFVLPYTAINFLQYGHFIKYLVTFNSPILMNPYTKPIRSIFIFVNR